MKNEPVVFAALIRSFSRVVREKWNNLFEGPARQSGVAALGGTEALETVPACCCAVGAPPKEEASNEGVVVKSAKSFSSVLISLLVAFFPKCPICWAAYMSMFGGLGVSRLPYQGWLYPVLIGFLSLHLILIFRNRRQKGLGPFAVSLAGVLILLISRALGVDANYPFIIGMLGILSGSLWNSFSLAPLKIPSLLKPHNV